MGPREPAVWESINAVTFATDDMASSVRFYETLGLVLTCGGKEAAFSTLGLGGSDNTFHVNLFWNDSALPQSWGRAIFYVSSVDGLYNRAVAAGLSPEFAPRDESWGERYFHIRDTAGHELAFAQPLSHSAKGIDVSLPMS